MSVSPDFRINFYDHLMPSVTAGEFSVEVEHRLWKDDGTRIDDPEMPTDVQRYVVHATRFALDAESVHACFPIKNASGRYDLVLPHITLSRSVLPWERQPSGERGDRPPWLALLVFAAGEVTDDVEARGEYTERTVEELLNPEEEGVLGPALPEGDVEDVSVRCRTIDVPAEVFTAVVPRMDELSSLVHAREVTTAPQRRDDAEVLSEGEFAVITANRFPRAKGAYAVHLVSLEGHEEHLTSLESVDADRVRLCSLYSWSFKNDPENIVDPGALLSDMAAPATGAGDAENLALRLVPAPARDTTTMTEEEEHARRRLHRGYAAVAYRVLSGEDTFAWYRGPFTPLTTPDLPPDEDGDAAYSTADHRLVYDPRHGLFDVSYAAAYTLGRTLALADPDYYGELTGARRELANRATVLRALGSDTTRATHDPDAPAGENALRRLAEPDLGATLLRKVQEPLTAGPPPPRAPATPTARPRVQDLLTDLRTLSSLRAVAEARTPTMGEWLERLSLLRGVPFSYLVPDARMLPAESMRAFRIDDDWIQALVQGASDVGTLTPTDRTLNTLLRERARKGRSSPLPGAGMLMHSELVGAWPSFDILATRGPEQDPDQVIELRRARLSSRVLLVLWDTVPDRVSIREPGQGIHFGVDGDEQNSYISLRHLTGDQVGYPTEERFPRVDEGSVFEDYLRPARLPNTADVLDLSKLLPPLSVACGVESLTPGQFALELVNSPIEQRLLCENDSLEDE